MDNWPANDVVASFNVGLRGCEKASAFFFFAAAQTFVKITKSRAIYRALHIYTARARPFTPRGTEF